MSDIIHLLPDTVANQIAAGEVIQRPASVIKELVENSIDAGATDIKIIIKDAGRTLIQVIDNGKGMSETDARLAFERHATSKIQSAQDLFELRTMGFRGEALASIASVAQVELRTRQQDDELGTLIKIAGCAVESQEPISCPVGTNFQVKNLFFNVPARRKFLKSNATEFSHIEREFFRIALVYPHITFQLTHNDQDCYRVPQSSHRERIVRLFGKNINAQLININVDSTIVRIFGFVGKPETAKKQNDKQYFFVNGRYMRHPYFHKAVLQAYDRMVQQGTSPDYFIYFEIAPESIDVNIHPTKTEIKFESEAAIWPLVMAGVKEALGKFNVIPAMDFEQETYTDMPVYNPNQEVAQPEIHTDPNYNPFAKETSYPRGSRMTEVYHDFFKEGKSKQTNTPTSNQSSRYGSNEEMFSSGHGVFEAVAPADNESFITPPTQHTQEEATLPLEGEENKTVYFQLKNKFILTSVKSGLMCIDQHRAHARILYDQYMSNITNQRGVSQMLLFPEQIELTEAESMLLEELKDDLSYLGFEIELFGKNTFAINGIPATKESIDAKSFILQAINAAKEAETNVKADMMERIARNMAETTAIKAGQILTNEEMMEIVNTLLSKKDPQFTPDNRLIFHILPCEEIEKRFK